MCNAMGLLLDKLGSTLGLGDECVGTRTKIIIETDDCSGDEPTCNGAVEKIRAFSHPSWSECLPRREDLEADVSGNVADDSARSVYDFTSYYQEFEEDYCLEYLFDENDEFGLRRLFGEEGFYPDLIRPYPWSPDGVFEEGEHFVYDQVKYCPLRDAIIT